MKVRGFGQQDRIKVALTRQDCERLWHIAQEISESESGTVVRVDLTPENDYGWAIPERARRGIATPTQSKECIVIVDNETWHLPKNARAPR